VVDSLDRGLHNGRISVERVSVKNRLTILLLCLTVLLVGPAASAQADTATGLPFPNGRSAWIAVDPAGRHVFVSGGPGTSSIVVLNYAGAVVKTIANQGGASGMALDSSSHTLYVALHDATAISEIDTQTLTESKRFSTGSFPDPSSLVIAGEKLWFSCTNGNGGCLVSANLDGSGMATPISGENLPLFLAAGGPNHHLLAFGYSEDSPPNLHVYDVSGSTPTLVSSSFAPNGDSSDVADMTFDPSGANLLLAAGAPYFIQSLATGTLASDGEYPTGPYPVAVAMTADGKYVAGGVNTGTGAGTDVFVYPVGSRTPVRTWSIGSGVPGLLDHALAFSPDASRLFAVTNGSAGHLQFDVLVKPTAHLAATRTSLTRSSGGTVRYGGRASLKVLVKGTKSGRVDLFATTAGQTTKLVATRTLHRGATRFTVEPKQATAYSAQLEQNGGYASSTSRSVKLAVRPTVTVTTQAQPGIVVRNGIRGVQTNMNGKVRPPRPYVVCTCGTHGELETMGFVVQQQAGRGWHTVVSIPPFTIGSGGVAHAFFVTNRPGTFRVQAKYEGDKEYRASQSAWTTFRVRHGV
jgi:hypothetical protein